MKRQKMTIIVEKTADGNFDCYPSDETQDYGISGYGATAQEAIEDIKSCMVEAKAALEEEGKTVPDYELEYKYDIGSFFSYFDVFNAAKLARMAGINKSLVSQYASGKRHASQLQYDRLRESVKKITADLEAATF